MSVNGDYFSNELIIDQWKREGKLIEVPFYRRTLHEIVNETIAYFSLEKLIEPQPTKAFKEEEPEKYEKLMKNAHFMIVRARKEK